MKLYAIGDVHGCYRELCQLLDKMSPGSGDLIWYCGDLVGRGPEPGEVLRLVASTDNAHTVLGNHDLHLLAVAAGVRECKPHWQLDDLLASAGVDDYLDWLRMQPLALAHRDVLMVHACLHPRWDESETLALAAEVGKSLRDAGWPALLDSMYGDEPDQWDPGLSGAPRRRILLNIFTRARYFLPDGRLNLWRDNSPDDGEDKEGSVPWFTLAHRRQKGTLALFGHWSALADYNIPAGHGVYHLDKGCVWGNRLHGVEISWEDSLGKASANAAQGKRKIQSFEVEASSMAG